MKTLVGSPPPEEPEDDGPVYVVTTLGRSDAFVTTGYNTITVTPALTNATTIWVPVADTLILLPSDYVRQLVDGFWTRERIPGFKPYVAQHASLLDQLENTLTGSTTGTDPVRGPSGSRPAGRIDVLAFLERIQQQSVELATELKSASAAAPCAASPYRRRARAHSRPASPWMVGNGSGADQLRLPAFTPNVPCPNEKCERRGTLRVKVGDAPEQRMAVCTECHWVWDGPYFGVFAEWVRWASEHLHSGHLCIECRLCRSLWLSVDPPPAAVAGAGHDLFGDPGRAVNGPASNVGRAGSASVDVVRCRTPSGAFSAGSIMPPCYLTSTYRATPFRPIALHLLNNRLHSSRR
jgi:hypothetical protein